LICHGFGMLPRNHLSKQILNEWRH
jgi:hypothetical protein